MLETLVLAAALIATPEMKQVPSTPPAVVATRQDPNQTGIKDSAYKGKFYLKGRFEPYRKCVAFREGRGQYWGTGSHGLYQSTYQMTAPLVRGAAWMMGPELRRMFGVKQGNVIQYRLLHTKGSKWSRFYMDMGFYTILNWKGPGEGDKHWHGGRYGCSLRAKTWKVA